MKIGEAVETVEERTGRSVAICSLTGSRNHGLQTADSDYDFKAFVVPSLDDMYDFKEYFRKIDGKGYEISVHDLRKLPGLLCKSNPTYLEVLFSDEMYMDDGLKDLLYENRERIARMDPAYMYNSAIGTCYHRMKTIEKGTETTQHLVKRYGYDTKQGMHGYRMLRMLEWMAEDGSFEKAARYKDSRDGLERRELLLSIRNGMLTLGELKELVETTRNEIEERYKEAYMGKEADREMKAMIENGIKEFVLRRLREGLRS